MLYKHFIVDRESCFFFLQQIRERGGASGRDRNTDCDTKQKGRKVEKYLPKYTEGIMP